MRGLPSRRWDVPIVRAVALGVLVGAVFALSQPRATGTGWFEDWICKADQGCQDRAVQGASGCATPTVWCYGSDDKSRFNSCRQAPGKWCNESSLGVDCGGLCEQSPGAVCSFKIWKCTGPE